MFVFRGPFSSLILGILIPYINPSSGSPFWMGQNIWSWVLTVMSPKSPCWPSRPCRWGGQPDAALGPPKYLWASENPPKVTNLELDTPTSHKNSSSRFFRAWVSARGRNRRSVDFPGGCPKRRKDRFGWGATCKNKNSDGQGLQGWESQLGSFVASLRCKVVTFPAAAVSKHLASAVPPPKYFQLCMWARQGAQLESLTPCITKHWDNSMALRSWPAGCTGTHWRPQSYPIISYLCAIPVPQQQGRIQFGMFQSATLCTFILLSWEYGGVSKPATWWTCATAQTMSPQSFFLWAFGNNHPSFSFWRERRTVLLAKGNSPRPISESACLLFQSSAGSWLLLPETELQFVLEAHRRHGRAMSSFLCFFAVNMCWSFKAAIEHIHSVWSLYARIQSHSLCQPQAMLEEIEGLISHLARGCPPKQTLWTRNRGESWIPEL